MEKAKRSLGKATQASFESDMSQQRKTEMDAGADILSEKASRYLASHDLKPPE
jgi:hypothetical protein